MARRWRLQAVLGVAAGVAESEFSSGSGDQGGDEGQAESESGSCSRFWCAGEAVGGGGQQLRFHAWVGVVDLENGPAGALGDGDAHRRLSVQDRVVEQVVQQLGEAHRPERDRDRFACLEEKGSFRGCGTWFLQLVSTFDLSSRDLGEVGGLGIGPGGGIGAEQLFG